MFLSFDAPSGSVNFASLQAAYTASVEFSVAAVYAAAASIKAAVVNAAAAISYFQSSTHDEKDWRVAYYSLRSALNLAEIELKSAIPKLKQSLKSVLLYKFKDKRIGKEYYIRKAEKFIE